MHKFIRSQRRGERGQTILLVAVSMIALLAMAALAIDVVTFYVARTEIQRAADAAALAGAKAIADSGLTSLPTGDSNFASGQVQTLAQSMATAAINAVLSSNLVGGSAPTLVGTPTFNFSTGAGQATAINNPTVKVTLQQPNLPTFFAKIFGRNAVSVQVSATAEAYNPANMPSPYLFTPIAPKCVKPWLVANKDPVNSGAAFVTTSTGATETTGSPTGSVIGETFYLTPDCNPAGNCGPKHNPMQATTSPPTVDYVPAAVLSNANNICPSCAGSTDFEKSVECCDVNPFIDGSTAVPSVLNCGGGTAHAQWDSTVSLPVGLGNASSTGAQCLTHAASPGMAQGQDTLDPITWPTNPLTIIAGTSSPFASKKVTTSSSIVTIPIVNPVVPPGGSDVTILGFLQAFIDCVSDGANPCLAGVPVAANPGDIQITVLNVVGCSTNPNTAPPVVGGMGTSPIPVRLITP